MAKSLTNSFYIAHFEKNLDNMFKLLKEKYYLLPDDVICDAIITCEWSNLLTSANRYINFYSLTMENVKKLHSKSILVIELLFLIRNKNLVEKETDTELVKGISSIPYGVLQIVLKSAQKLWTKYN
jgi:hypothetical protein